MTAEFARVPSADSTLIKVPNKLEDKEWLFLSDIFPTAWTGLDYAGFQAGDTVAVFGAGPVGLLCAYSAIIRGASTVFVVDHVAARLAKATEIGAIPINFTKGGEASQQILALKPGGIQRCVDCVGEECVNSELKPQQDYVINEMVKITSFYGGIGILGVYLSLPTSAGNPRAATVKPTMNFPISDFWVKGLSMRGGIVNAKQVVSILTELVMSGKARPGFIVSGEFDINDASEAYSRFDRHFETKAIFKFRGPSSNSQDNGEAIAAETEGSETPE
jgi:threonine dehydrogenase-like Zn-dependent dehydrogenase